MRVIDFIQEKSDCMNETDYFKTLYALADTYGLALREKGFRLNKKFTDKHLLSGFLLQEIQANALGEYVLANIRA